MWRRCGDGFDGALIMEHDSFSGGSVMVWRCIFYDRRTDQVIFRGNLTGQRYINEILRSHAICIILCHARRSFFLQHLEYGQNVEQ